MLILPNSMKKAVYLGKRSLTSTAHEKSWRRQPRSISELWMIWPKYGVNGQRWNYDTSKKPFHIMIIYLFTLFSVITMKQSASCKEQLPFPRIPKSTITTRYVKFLLNALLLFNVSAGSFFTSASLQVIETLVLLCRPRRINRHSTVHQGGL